MGAFGKDSGETLRMLQEIETGDREAFGRLLLRYRHELVLAAARRLDHRIRRRVDVSDVVQETQLRVFERLDDYLGRRPMPFRDWLRAELNEQIRKLERRHMAAQKRTVSREVPLAAGSATPVEAVAGPTPSGVARRREAADEVRTAMARMSESDQEVIVLRVLEHLSSNEVASLLGISPEAAQKRYRRALIRLQELLQENLG